MVLRFLGHAVVLALVLGFATAAIWVLFGRRAFLGGISHAVVDAGVVIYGVLLIVSFAIGFVWARRPWHNLSYGSAVALFTLAWLLQGLVVFAVFAGDSDLSSAEMRIGVWLVATGAVLQPVAAVGGAWLQTRRAT